MSKDNNVIEKVMALTRAEFEHSLAKFDFRLAARSTDSPVQIPFVSGTVTISFEPLPSETVGRLLTLPRARILLSFAGLNADEQQVFLNHFDRAFQRGGG